ncbi:HvfC/BufC N-terminal domain-containing protein [Methylosinus sp. LW4]|uniref:HvfC/BufC N-terminal domain-containing protein n=1 Tax=Methylosinus sp. LW4 TaxID=136993 RepID=UPI00036499D8|nr:DNA-binding domain-containing protein [Methylosinus sp. LW4]
MWERTQAQFAAALLDARQAAPASLASERGAAADRFEVYRNSVVGGLVRALAARFPAVVRLVGEEFFAAMAREFLLLRPPKSAVLLEYGEDFADFVAGFAPVSELPYLADVARLEDARVRAYHAADREPLSPQALASVAHDRLAELTFEIHPSAYVLRSDHPMVTIWAMNAGEAEAAPLEHWDAEDALVTRPHMRVETHRLAPGGAAFLQRLAVGAEFGDAVRVATAEKPTFDLSEALVEALTAGFFTAIRGDT